MINQIVDGFTSIFDGLSDVNMIFKFKKRCADCHGEGTRTVFPKQKIGEPFLKELSEPIEENCDGCKGSGVIEVKVEVNMKGEKTALPKSDK